MPPSDFRPASTVAESPSDPVLSWRATLRAYLQPAGLRLFALGFAAGLPLLPVHGPLSFRLRDAGPARATIRYLRWVVLA